VQQRNVEQRGRGTRRDPYLYLLPGMAVKWQSRFVEDFMRRLAEDEKDAGQP
jgi:hypothetical protein